jgi:hypothetical protein
VAAFSTAADRAELKRGQLDNRARRWGQPEVEYRRGFLVFALGLTSFGGPVNIGYFHEEFVAAQVAG